MKDYSTEFMLQIIRDGRVCPICSFYLHKADPKAQRYEHDMKHHPKYFAMQMGWIKIK